MGNHRKYGHISLKWGIDLDLNKLQLVTYDTFQRAEKNHWVMRTKWRPRRHPIGKGVVLATSISSANRAPKQKHPDARRNEFHSAWELDNHSTTQRVNKIGIIFGVSAARGFPAVEITRRSS